MNNGGKKNKSVPSKYNIYVRLVVGFYASADFVFLFLFLIILFLLVGSKHMTWKDNLCCYAKKEYIFYICDCGYGLRLYLQTLGMKWRQSTANGSSMFCLAAWQHLWRYQYFKSSPNMHCSYINFFVIFIVVDCCAYLSFV